MKIKKLAALLLGLMMLAGVLPTAAFAADGAYVLMNIPYAEFYQAELGEKDTPDAVTAATAQKRSNGGLAKGSYHVGAEGAGVDGVTYPVYVSDLSVLDSAKEITDASSVEVTTTARGTTTTTTYTGREALFEAPDYAWYRLGVAPAYFKGLTVGKDGKWHFGAVQGQVKRVEGVTAEIIYNGRHTDIELKLSGTEGIQTGDAVNAVVITTADGAKYGLGHVTNIWRGVELGWDDNDVMKAGKKAVSITNIRYITAEAVIDYPVSIQIEERGIGGFTNISPDAWYAQYVDWAAEKGYLSNQGDGKFDPEKRMTRGEIVNSLWNAAGRPAPETTENPFTDVDEKAGYYRAALWAKEQGITDGTGSGAFTPDGTVDRRTLVTLLWKQAGKPAPATKSNPFGDVSETAWYRDAVLWAVENKVTDGTGEGRFSPEELVTCSQIAGFLYKNAHQPH